MPDWQYQGPINHQRCASTRCLRTELERYCQTHPGPGERLFGV